MLIHLMRPVNHKCMYGMVYHMRSSVHWPTTLGQTSRLGALVTKQQIERRANVDEDWYIFLKENKNIKKICLGASHDISTTDASLVILLTTRY